MSLKTVMVPDIDRNHHLVRVFGTRDHENCCVCGKTTPHWSERKDVPLCISCADITPHHKVPSKRKWLESMGFDLGDDWKPMVEQQKG